MSGSRILIDMRHDGAFVYGLSANDAAKEAIPIDLSNQAETAQQTAGAEIILSLPFEMLNFKLMEMPFDDIEKIRAVLPFEIEGLVMDKEIVIDARMLGKTEDDKQSVLAVFSRKKNLAKLLEDLKAGGIDPKVVTSLELGFALKSGIGSLNAMIRGESSMSADERAVAAQDEIKSPSINLRRGDFAYTKEEEGRKKSALLAFVLAVLFVLVMTGGTAMKFLDAKKKAGLLRADIRKTYQEMFPEDKKITSETLQARSKLKELEEKGKIFIGVSPLSAMLKATERLQGATITEISVDKTAIVIKGETASLGDAEKLKSRLSEAFTDVKLIDTKTLPLSKVAFTITAKEKE